MVNVVLIGMMILLPIMFTGGAFIAIYSFKQGLGVGKQETYKDDGIKFECVKEENKSNVNPGLSDIKMNIVLDEYLNGAREGAN